MAVDISDTTGEIYYSSTFEDIKKWVSILNIDGGALDNIGNQNVAVYQEDVDRLIDDEMSEVYHVPFRAINRVQPDGDTVTVFPGQLIMVARYWVAGLLFLNEFQQLGTNTSDQAEQYLTIARRRLYSLRRFENRLIGQEFKSNISRTIPPSMQPPARPEANF